jgi:CRISPR-associated protein Cas1
MVLAPHAGADLAVVQPAHSANAHLRGLQVLRRDDPQMLRVGLAMLSAKVSNQASVLRYFARYRKKTDADVHRLLLEAASAIRAAADRLDALGVDQAGLRSVAMGHEGQAAARYWGAVAALLPASLAFPGRRTHQAGDVVNSALNYTYALLYGEVWRAVTRAGLDPYFAILHGAEHDQGSLVFDLIEELRAPVGDRQVFALIGRGLLLQQDDEGLLLNDVRKKLAEAFRTQWTRPIRAHGREVTPAALLEHQVGNLKRCYQGKGTYQAFRFRW